jgi:membrane-associated phospholipid phosphatase
VPKSILRLDEAVVVWLNRLVRQQAWFEWGVGGMARWLAGIEIGLMLVLAIRGRRESAVRMLGAVGLVYVACDALGLAWPRLRPFAGRSEVQPLVRHDALRSFPSRHVASGLAMAAIGGRAHPNLGAAMTLAAWLLGVSRVAAGLHYPSDVLAGAALGRIVGQSFR